MKAVRVRFTRIEYSDPKKDTDITTIDTCVVPDRGEAVDVLGSSYVVHERRWAVASGEKEMLRCTVRLSPLLNPRFGF